MTESVHAGSTGIIARLPGGSGALREQGLVDACLYCWTSSKRDIPLFLQRPAAPPAWPKLELTLADAVHQLKASQGDRRRPVGFEPKHRSAPALDRPVVLLDDVVQVAAHAYQDVFPAMLLATEPAQAQMTRFMAVERDLPRPPMVRRM